MDKPRGFPSSDTHLTVGWVVRASQNLPSRRSGLTCPPRATTASPAAVLLAGPLAIGTNQGIHTCSSLTVLPTRAFPGGTPRTFSCEGAPPIYSTGVLPATFRHRAARLSPWLKPGACAAQETRSIAENHQVELAQLPKDHTRATIVVNQAAAHRRTRRAAMSVAANWWRR